MVNTFKDAADASFQHTVLIAEDEPLIRMAYAEFLSDCGFFPIAVHNGDAAVELLQKRVAIDIVLSDIRMSACVHPGKPPEDDGGVVTLAKDAMARHDLFASLFASALACGQTNVVNLTITEGMSGLRFEGETASHHSLSHEEPIDPTLGYQKKCFEYQKVYMEALLKFAQAMDAIKEGDKTMLDRMLVFAYTDHGAPRLHSLHNYPVITVGSAGGRLKTGMHVAHAGQPITRVSLTAMQAMGVPISSFRYGIQPGGQRCR